jgi:uncharacterized protein
MKKLRALSLDGGGMRGTYTAHYLSCLADAFATRRGVKRLDIGKAFDLIVGTSTGAIIACALANQVPLTRVIALYTEEGRGIFPMPLPKDRNLPRISWDVLRRPDKLELGVEALRTALVATFGSATLGQVYAARQIALAIPAVEMEHHQSFVFKTPHLSGSMHRDDDYTLVDVCLATTAAPVYRSLAAIANPNAEDTFRVFADGGLWANNPVLVALVDALEMTNPGDEIEIFSLGTCPPPAGEFIAKEQVHRGLSEWKFGGDVANLGINVQQFAYDQIAQLLKPHLNRKCSIVRFPGEKVPAALVPYLGLDDTSPQAANALRAQAQRDAEMANSISNKHDDRAGSLLRNLFMDMPVTGGN